MSEAVLQAKAAYQRDYRVRRRAVGEPLPERTPEQRKHHDWWKLYRLRPDQVMSMWATQGKSCAVCAESLAAPGESRHTHIDHCHTSGRVRGILCSRCNLMLGHAKDSPARLLAGAAYLEDRNPTTLI